MKQRGKSFAAIMVIVIIALVATFAIVMTGCGGDDEPVTMIGITVTKAPNKTTYLIGELFERTGMVVKAQYSDGSEEEVADFTVESSGTRGLTADDSSVKVIYKEDIGNEQFKDHETTLPLTLIAHPGNLEIVYQAVGTLVDPGLMAYNIQSTALMNFYKNGLVVAYGYNWMADAAVTGSVQGTGVVVDSRRGIYVSGTWSESTVLGTRTVSMEVEFWSTAGGDPTRTKNEAEGIVDSDGNLNFVLSVPIGSGRAVGMTGSSTVVYKTVESFMTYYRQYFIDNPVEGINRNIIYSKIADDGVSQFIVYDNFTCAVEIDGASGKMILGDNIKWEYKNSQFTIDFSENSDYDGSGIDGDVITVVFSSPFASDTVNATLSVKDVVDIINAPAGDEIFTVADGGGTFRLSWNGKSGTALVDIGMAKVGNIAWTYDTGVLKFKYSLVNPGDFDNYTISEKDGTWTVKYVMASYGLDYTFTFDLADLEDAIDEWTLAQDAVEIGNAPYVFSSIDKTDNGTVTLNADGTVTTDLKGNLATLAGATGTWEFSEGLAKFTITFDAAALGNPTSTYDVDKGTFNIALAGYFNFEFTPAA